MSHNLDHELTAKTKLEIQAIKFPELNSDTTGNLTLKSNKVLLYVLEKNAIDLNKEYYV
jgi:hypothetical protein